MAYSFSAHRNNLFRNLKFFPWLFLAQLPEGFLGIIQKITESTLSDYPFWVFIILYPLYCLSSAVCSALTLLVLVSRRDGNIFPWSTFFKSLRKLFLTSLILGLLMIPATLALIVPGIYLLSRYLFIPFLVIVSPDLHITSYFSQSKTLANPLSKICILTALFSFGLSLVSFLGTGAFGSLLDSPVFSVSVESLTSMLVGFVLNTWTATLFLEVSQNERIG